MATGRVIDSDVHLHWTFKKRTAQLRLARVIHAPAQWNGVCRLSDEVAYVRFFADGRTGYFFWCNNGATPPLDYRFDLPSILREQALAEIELRFRARLAAQALTGAETHINPRESRVGTPCANCPPCVGERIKLFSLPEFR